MSDDAKCYAATPAATLEQHITDSNVAKNEAEWWAYHEISRLREENARLRKAVKNAYYEGCLDHVSREYPRQEIHKDWETSAAAAAIREGGK